MNLLKKMESKDNFGQLIVLGPVWEDSMSIVNMDLPQFGSKGDWTVIGNCICKMEKCLVFMVSLFKTLSKKFDLLPTLVELPAWWFWILYKPGSVWLWWLRATLKFEYFCKLHCRRSVWRLLQWLLSREWNTMASEHTIYIRILWYEGFCCNVLFQGPLPN